MRVGPYRFCDVLQITRCDIPETVGELDVTSRDPVQLSVPPSIARAPWVLLRAYEGSGDSVVEEFRPNSKLAVTIPTVDPRRGRLTGIVVALPRRTAGAATRWSALTLPTGFAETLSR